MEWISVDKQLPPESVPVLVTDSPPHELPTVFAAYYYGGDWKTDASDGDGCPWGLYYVTHWALYPAPAQPAAPQEVEA